MADENEIIDSTNDTEVVETEETTESTETAEVDVEKLKEINRKLFERAKKAEAEAKAFKAKQTLTTKSPKVKIEDDVLKDIEQLKLSEKKRQAGYKFGLSPEETDKLFAYAGDTDPEQVLKDPFFQAGLKEVRAQKRVSDAIPSSSNRSTKVDGKSFAEMTEEERAKNWNKVFKK